MTESLPSTMKAWLYSNASGGLEKHLTFNPEARTPGTLRQNHVLIQVISASINPADYKVPELGLASKVVITTPATPGMDFCGRVVIIGPDVSDFHPDQLVYGSIGIPSQFGSLGEYLVCAASTIAALPEGVDPDHAATVGVAGQTAYQSLAPYVSAGEKVLINGGSGGVGIFAIQIAKLLGCHVTTTCSTRNVQFCKDLGADEVIDYTQTDVLSTLKSQGHVYSHVVDHIGLPEGLYRECDAFLLPGKVFVQVGAASMLTFARRLVRPSFLGGGKRKYVILLFKNNKADIVRIGEWIQQGKVRVVVDSTYELQDAVKAFEKLRSGRARGKIIIHVGQKP
ncbi:NAD(P)-dependent alcohol dehydrogenase [Aspergillus clavatus NRRL 1]|uniref:Zinc alcohol dehydrogenase, putative n=1 Tax=Aspergillus clavatus (strain ATCC 1007 / CBS 513.65 / DSM 816 / NCTC 3887 / NRRL 1 / QM 1276 / 107) TaxID=344612 RepID=A1CTH6_ASPCL|nr:zinc alcohol dehydrogenase, putative [Aspergillus clavatus NRRL 1]EAW06613.1 zinc alcohol dehydrogenase, putative [Aspergillus clavatus NRRL 1]